MSHIVIIGAGFGGLSAAAYAAKAGHRVTVLEATNQIGGRARVLKSKGFTFDLGPSWYLMPDAFEDWFADFGHKPSDFYDLRQLTPSYKVFTGSRTIEVPRAPQVYDVFEAIEPGSGQRLKQLLAKTKREYAAVRGGLLKLDGLAPQQALRPDVLGFLLRPELARSYHSRIARYIRTPDLQHILEFMTVFMGGSPHNIPAYYSLLAHVDMGLGVWYPMGGFSAVARGFAAVAKEAGASIRLNTPVQSIEVKNGRAVAVHTPGGRIACDTVIANADYQFVETTLLPPEAQAYSKRYWQRRAVSPSGLVAVLGVDRPVPGLRHHNLFFDTNWDEHFADVFTRRRWSKNPLFYVCVPSKTDPSVAPKGHENMFILAPMTAGTNPSQTEVDATAARLVSRIETATGQNITKHIVTQTNLGPAYFSQTFNAFKGNAFGLSHTLTQSAVLRPRLQSRKVANLFYTGQYTNPGTGLPMVIQSGALAAKLAHERGV